MLRFSSIQFESLNIQKQAIQIEKPTFIFSIISQPKIMKVRKSVLVKHSITAKQHNGITANEVLRKEYSKII